MTATVSPKEIELEFDFGSRVCRKLDGEGGNDFRLLKRVDFVVEEEDRLLLVEVKDPSKSTSTASPEEIAEWGTFGKLKTCLHERVVPQARGAYCYLHLMEEDSKPMDLVWVIGLERVSFDQKLLGPVLDELRRRLRKEGETPWRRQYIREAYVTPVADFSRFFAPYTVTRVEP